MTVKVDILAQVKNNPAYSSKNSWQWFQHHVRNLATNQGMKPFDMFNQTGVSLSSNLLPGQMVSFFYSPKHKDKLPYWDTFPLILPFSKTATHFTALNLHYLPVRTRLILFNKLLSFANDDSMTSKTRLLLSWRFLKSASKFPEVAPCVKQYIIGYVKSKFMVIEPNSWPVALFLPTESFKQASNTQVWKDSTGYRKR